MRRKKLTREQKKELRADKIKNNMTGSGIYVYENNTDADLTLPKPTASGVRSVSPRNRFQGDSYYMNWVGPPMNLLKLVEEILPKTNPTNTNVDPIVNEECNMNQKKLILDQPDTVTNQGKVEHVLVDENSAIQPINDATDSSPKADVLLNESPLDGLEIILG
jgi:hypothetical protein